MAKITQGIGKKLNPSEARASISLHKIAQKKAWSNLSDLINLNNNSQYMIVLCWRPFFCGPDPELKEQEANLKFTNML